jgi:hypothetical protein
VVEGELACLLPAVLAGMSVPVKDLGAGQLTVDVIRSFHQIRETDNGRDGKHPVSGMQKPGAVFQHLRLALVDEHDSTADVADIERFVVLV